MSEREIGDLLIDTLIEQHPLIKNAKRQAVLLSFSNTLAMARLDGTSLLQDKHPVTIAIEKSKKPVRAGFNKFDPT